MSYLPLIHGDLERTARRIPERCALVQGARRLSYADLDAASTLLAKSIVHSGVGRGDRVIILGENSVEAAEAFWAVLKADAIATILGPGTRPQRLAYVLKQTRAALLIADGRLFSVVEQALAWFHSEPAPMTSAPARREPRAATRGTSDTSVPPRVILFGRDHAMDVLHDLPSGFDNWPSVTNWDGIGGDLERGIPLARKATELDLASIVYTSGTSGAPKGVMMTHHAMRAAAASIASYLDLREEDVILNVLPFSFSYGLYQMIMAFRAGACVVLGRSFAFPAEVVRLLVEEQVTMFPGVPPYFAILASMDRIGEHDFSHVRCVTNAAAALSHKRIMEVRAIFPKARVFSMYGQTECVRTTYLPPEDLDRKPDSVGIPIPNTEIWIEDESGKQLEPPEIGELIVRSPTVMLGYWEDPESTQKRIGPGPLPGQSVLRTGDLFRQDDEGYLYFVGRMDDIMNCGGEKVAPLEIEGVIRGLAGISDVAVLGVPDDVLGEAVHAVVALERGSGLTETDVQRHCRAHLELVKIPKIVQIVEEVPRTNTGKIVRAALRALVAARTEK